jgi:predicted nuclease of restriction endonuclease-like (RecB) superfamily
MGRAYSWRDLNSSLVTLGPSSRERELERGLLDHIKDLLLELGKGFAF